MNKLIRDEQKLTSNVKFAREWSIAAIVIGAFLFLGGCVFLGDKLDVIVITGIVTMLIAVGFVVLGVFALKNKTRVLKMIDFTSLGLALFALVNILSLVILLIMDYSDKILGTDWAQFGFSIAMVIGLIVALIMKKNLKISILILVGVCALLLVRFVIATIGMFSITDFNAFSLIGLLINALLPIYGTLYLLQIKNKAEEVN